MSLQAARLGRALDRAPARGGVELAVDRAGVCLHGVQRDVELARNLRSERSVARSRRTSTSRSLSSSPADASRRGRERAGLSPAPRGRQAAARPGGVEIGLRHVQRCDGTVHVGQAVARERGGGAHAHAGSWAPRGGDLGSRSSSDTASRNLPWAMSAAERDSRVRRARMATRDAMLLGQFERTTAECLGGIGPVLLELTKRKEARTFEVAAACCCGPGSRRASSSGTRAASIRPRR